MKIQGENRTVSFWSWNGNIDRDGIDWQLREFADGRIGGVVIHARSGLKIAYLGDEWLDLFKYAVSRAKEYGLEVWIYDEEGWPSGFGGGHVTSLGEAYHHKNLHYVDDPLSFPSDVSEKQIVAIYEKTGEGAYVRRDDLTLQTAPANSLVFWYTVDSYYVDLLNPDVTAEFLKSTHEKYYREMGEYFGSVIKGFFTDEPQLNNEGYPWSVCLRDAFRDLTGRDLMDELWKVAAEAPDSETVKTLLWNTVAELYHNSFVHQLSQWCERHGVALCGHFAAEDGMCGQLPSCGDLMRNYSAMRLPTIDHLGSRVASPVLMKQAASVSRQYWDGRVMCETFGAAGWNVSFRRLAWIWGGQSVLGITKPCYHLSAYSIEGRRKRDYPAFFSYQEPWWDEFRSFAAWMQRLNDLMTQGERHLHTLVIPPQSGVKSRYWDAAHNQDEIKRLSAEFRMLVENLLDIQVDFDLGDEYLLCRDAVIGNGSLRLGKVTYDTVILAETTTIAPSLCDVLQEFSRSGGRLLAINSMPRDWQGNAIPDVLVNRRDTLEKFVEYLDIARPVTVARIDTLKPVSGLRLHTRKIDGGYRTHIWANDGFSQLKAYLRFGEKANAYAVDLLNGSRRKLPVRVWDGGTLVPVTIDAQTNTVIELEPSPECAAVPQETKTAVQAVMQADVRLCESNALTLDYAQLSLDGGATYSPRKPVVQFLDTIYDKVNGSLCNIALRYAFSCGDGLAGAGIKLVLEDRSCKQIEVNGHKLTGERSGWWIDHSLGIYDIEPFIVPGENAVVLRYEIKPQGSAAGLLEVFETEINRFCYPVEPESIYILGDFDVSLDGEINDCGYCYRTNGEFRLVPKTEKQLGDLTRQDLWFYRGNAEYTFTIQKPVASGKTIVSVDAYHGTAVTLQMGGKKLISMECPATFDVTELLTAEENKVTLTLLGSNRNLMGPHHHVNGECYLIGPAVFEGRWDELTGFLSPGLYGKKLWTDEYGVVPFGIERISVETFV